MSKADENKSEQTGADKSTDLTVMIKRMQQQLVFLEKKIDTLISQTGSRPARAEFSRRPAPRGRGDYGRGKPSSFGRDSRPGRRSDGPGRGRGESSPKKFFSRGQGAPEAKGYHSRKKPNRGRTNY